MADTLQGVQHATNMGHETLILGAVGAGVQNTKFIVAYAERQQAHWYLSCSRLYISTKGQQHLDHTLMPTCCS